MDDVFSLFVSYVTNFAHSHFGSSQHQFFPDLTWHGTVMMGHTRALVTIRTVGGSMVYINNQLASEFLQLLSGDGQTIDNDIQRRADTVTTSMQLQKTIGNILGRLFHSLGTALLAARQVQKASNSAKLVWTRNSAQDRYFFNFPEFRR